jgi:transcriptional regulator with XRE-family HTH domain
MPTPSKYRRNPMLIALGSTIRRIRLEQGITQEQLALIAEVDRSYVGDVERGDNSCSVIALTKMAQALQTTAGELLIEAGI